MALPIPGSHLQRLWRCGLLSSRRPEGRTDPGDSIRGGLVLPDSQDGPPGCGQRAFVFEIAPTSGLQLAGPPLGIGLRKTGVLGASVPEAAVDEHGHTQARKKNVGLAAEPGHRSTMLEEAEAGTVKGGPQRDL